MGVWEHTDSLTQSPNRASLEINTNTERILLVTSIALSLASLGIKMLQLPAQLLIGSPGTLDPTRVPGLPIRDCTRDCNNRAQMCLQLSTIDVTAKTFFERLYLVLGLCKIVP